MPDLPDDYWSAPASALLDALAGSPSGLTGADAQRRLVEHGPNLVERRQRDSDGRLLGRQLASPLVGFIVAAELTKHWFYRRSPRRRRVLRVVAPS